MPGDVVVASDGPVAEGALGVDPEGTGDPV
jgi:hypothetical protein